MIKLGVEEEFFLVDPESRDLLADSYDGDFEACDALRVRTGSCGSTFERKSIPIHVCMKSVAELRAALLETRWIVVESAEAYGAAVMAPQATGLPTGELRPPCHANATSGSR